MITSLLLLLLCLQGFLEYIFRREGTNSHFRLRPQPLMFRFYMD